MKKSIRIVARCSIIVIGVMCATNVFAWTKYINFNNGVLGSQTYNNDGFSDAAGGTYYDNGEAYEGGQSAKLTIEAGKTGYGKWGGVINYPSNLVKGDEIWLRVRTFMPVGFNYDSSSEGEHLKFLRIHTRSPAVSNEGYNDWYINPATAPESSSPHKFIFEGEQRWSTAGGYVDRPQLGVWEVYEIYLKLDTKSVNDGGNAIVKMWKNGKLLGEFRDRYTLVNDDSYSDRTHVFTYWNGGAPKTQHMWLDDVVITSETPSEIDEYGNSYIGVGQAAPSAPPVVEANKQ
ncbi:hypothetical protein [Dasania marina]|uniref:hypothetical protein n=1 Tax=Dasania marina TaxID=471499 RepID=UPI0030DB4ABD|tara:strand:+ start:88372 stop:89238 length:867 start_codon:yes stop_codon:yes gene_type:complete